MLKNNTIMQKVGKAKKLLNRYPTPSNKKKLFY